MIHTASFALLLIAGSVVAFMAFAGVMEYIVYPLWDQFKPRIQHAIKEVLR